jgi:short-chain Z-isoprenyl diphosphate synthase
MRPADTATSSTPAAVRSEVRRSSHLRSLWRLLRYVIKQPFYRLYERRLAAQAASWARPQHIGIIMDGNRRFARRSGLIRVGEGHARGAEKLREVLTWCYELEIPVVTVWSFSLDNLNRDTSEVEDLLRLFEEETRRLVDRSEVHKHQIRVRYLGKLEVLPDSLRQAIRIAEEATSGYDRHQLNIAMAYGGREEITDAFRRYLAERAAAGASLPEVAESFEEAAIEPYLYTSGLPEPDLILRTSGEVRLSGFLLWQSAYSEYYFCDALWPAFRKIDLLRALRAYHQRHRRFGR